MLHWRTRIQLFLVFVLLVCIWFTSSNLWAFVEHQDPIEGWAADGGTLRPHRLSCPGSAGLIHSFVLPEKPNGDLSHNVDRQILSTCEATGQVEIFPKCSSLWELQSLDTRGKPKYVGGDEFYITYTDDELISNGTSNGEGRFTAAAWLTEKERGRYLLDFQCAPFADCQNLIGTGLITVNFQYTCGIGHLGPPMKSDWPTGGNTVASYSHRVSIPPKIRSFVPPDDRPNLYDFDLILPVGDSLLQQFLLPIGIRSGNIGKPLNTSTVQQWKDHITSRFGRTGRLNSNRTALLLGSAVWDLLEDQIQSGNDAWEDHGRAWHDLVAYIRHNYPNVTILWKSATALHVHVPMLRIQQNNTKELKGKIERDFHQRVKYMSVARSEALYQAQKMWCANQSVKFLDVYSASYLAPDETQIGDGRHFTSRLNARMINWFVNESYVERLWRERQKLQSAPRSQKGQPIRLLAPPRCQSWVDLVNAVLVATVSNHHLVWESPRCALEVDSSAFPFLHTSMNDLGEVETVSWGGSNEVFNIERLEKLGLIPSMPFKQLADELFSQGDGYLYGMILWKSLAVPASVSLPQPTVVSGSGTASSTTIAILSNPTVSALDFERIKLCFDKMLSAKTKPCHVIVPSAAIQQQFLTMFQEERTMCSSSVILTVAASENGGLEFLNALSSVLDGVIFPCNSHHYRLTRSLLEYRRQSNARNKGRLPLENLPSCCW